MTAILVVASLSALPLSRSAAAEIRIAADPSFIAVYAKVQEAVDGDTVVIPAGTAEWSSTLTVNKAITLQGNGIGKTIIRDNVPNGIMLSVAAVPGKLTRITGIEFERGARRTKQFIGSLSLSGINTDGGRIRVDHCRFEDLQNLCTMFINGALGVSDHNEVVLTGTTFMHFVEHSNWNGGAWGDRSWADGPDFGTDQFWFIEDNDIENASFSFAVMDGQKGARYVFRNNTVRNGSIEWHGTESGQRARGGRAFEIYGNVVTMPAGPRPNFVYARSGTALIHNNTVDGFAGSMVSLQTNRFRAVFTPWRSADGTVRWDTNGPNPFDAGIATLGGGLTMTDTSKNWATNQWAGYTLRNVNANFGSYILSNTSNTITFSDAGGFNSLSFLGGESYQINNVIEAIDQCGKGQGDDLGGADNPPEINLNQIDEPVHEWNNTYNGGNGNISSQWPAAIRAGEHFLNDTPKPGYAPYTYPHPLISGQIAKQPSAPTNLRVTDE